MVIFGQYRMFSQLPTAYYVVHHVTDAVSVTVRQKRAYPENCNSYVAPEEYKFGFTTLA